MTESVPTIPYRKASKPRVNPRLLLVGLIIAAPIAWMVYTFAKLSIGEGIEQVGEYKQVDLKSMGNFPFNDQTDGEAQVPEVYRRLDGQKVLLIGQQYVDYTAEPTVTRFQLVYSIQNCCFNGPPKVQERVFANAPKGKKVPVYGGLARVYGTLHVKAIRENGTVVSLYEMDIEKMAAD